MIYEFTVKLSQNVTIVFCQHKRKLVMSRHCDRRDLSLNDFKASFQPILMLLVLI